MWNNVVIYTSFVSALLVPQMSVAGDLSSALEFVQNKSDSALVGGYIQHIETDRVSIMGLLEARDISPDKALEDYDCIEDGRMDRFWSPKYSKGEFRLVARHCVEAQFKHKHVRGYRTMGHTQLNHRLVRKEITKAADAADVPEILIREIIALSSGYRPGAVSDDGKIGMMQLRPDVAERFGADNPYDAVQNIRAGANYLAHLLDKHDNVLPTALAEYRGASESELTGGEIPKRRALIWWVRAITKQYEIESADFPEELGWENIALVASWLN